VSTQITPSVDAARAFIEASSFIWHQRFELAPGVYTPGVNDLDLLFGMASFGDDLTGRTVLDIGTTNGGAAFMLERLGAERVVAVDVCSDDLFGIAQTRNLLGSSVEYVQGTVYELSALMQGETFDVVLFWGVLYHLRHPLLGLDQIRAVVSPAGELSIETAVSDHELASVAHLPVARFFRRGELGGDPSNWFAPTVVGLKEWCASAGLTIISEHVWGNGPGERCLMMARRTEGDPEYATISYEVPLRGTPAEDRR
jgi:tRNA (mo5U34)-methyltransferase